MVTLDCTTSAHDGVTLVTVRLRDIDGPTRVRISSRLDGPVWPPRREGVPERGWTDEGFDGVVGPGTDVLGYATPAPPSNPPAELVTAEPVADTHDELTTDPESVLRQLGDPTPPADAVPTGDGEPAADADPVPRDGHTFEVDGDTEPPETATASAAGARSEPLGAPDRDDETATRDGGTADLPAAVGPWLAEMARRTDRAERLSEVETVPEATEAVRAAGGLAAVRDLAEADDAAQLRALARRARRLADRRAGATIPVDTLDALA